MVFGDATAEPVLEAAGVEKARLVTITVPDALTTRLVVERVRRLNPTVHIVARADTVAELKELSHLGVYEVVQPEFEAGLELGRQALSHLGVSATEIQQISDRVRGELYAPMTDGSADREFLRQLHMTSRMIETEWVTISENSIVVGKTIGALGIRSGTGASVVAIIRESEMLPNPGPEASFEPGDVVGVLGTPDQRAFFRELTYESHRPSSYFFED